MPLIKSKLLKYFEIDGENKTISIAYENLVTDDSTNEVYRKKFRQAFFPGQIEDVKAWAGLGNTNPYIIFLNAIWTPAVISAYQASQPF